MTVETLIVYKIQMMCLTGKRFNIDKWFFIFVQKIVGMNGWLNPQQWGVGHHPWLQKSHWRPLKHFRWKIRRKYLLSGISTAHRRQKSLHRSGPVALGVRPPNP